jgi:hypothetical protein
MNDLLPKDPVTKVIEEAAKIESTKNRLDLGRNLVRSRFKINDDGIEAVEFIFWMVYYLERLTQDVIIETESKAGARREAIQKIVDKLHFGDKISILSDLYIENKKKDDYIKFLWKVNDLRNDVAHGRFNELTYKNYNLSGSEGQLKLINDYINFAKNVAPRTG